MRRPVPPGVGLAPDVAVTIKSEHEEEVDTVSKSRLDEMKALLKAHYEAAVNEQDLELLDRQLTGDFVDHGMPPGPEPV